MHWQIKRRWNKLSDSNKLVQWSMKNSSLKNKNVIQILNKLYTECEQCDNISMLTFHYNHSRCHSWDCLQSCCFLKATINVLFTLCLQLVDCEHTCFVISFEFSVYWVLHIYTASSTLSSTSQWDCCCIFKCIFQGKKFFFFLEIARIYRALLNIYRGYKLRNKYCGYELGRNVTKMLDWISTIWPWFIL